ncbi:hypothetical protein H8356DRAFT_1432229 [Neocallimastix lanati (nom. inval.)]|nr:hypothetical protein H8356DRAFT_1432229 [Neocallimastix sp. JGI-2020a]
MIQYLETDSFFGESILRFSGLTHNYLLNLYVAIFIIPSCFPLYMKLAFVHHEACHIKLSIEREVRVEVETLYKKSNERSDMFKEETKGLLSSR